MSIDPVARTPPAFIRADHIKEAGTSSNYSFRQGPTHSSVVATVPDATVGSGVTAPTLRHLDSTRFLATHVRKVDAFVTLTPTGDTLEKHTLFRTVAPIVLTAVARPRRCPTLRWGHTLSASTDNLHARGTNPRRVIGWPSDRLTRCRAC